VIQVMLWLPVAVGLLCFVVPWRSVPVAAVLGTLATLGLAVALVASFHSGDPGLQHAVDESWIPDLGVRYQLGVDGISIFMVLLTALLWAGATAFSAFRMPDRRRIYFFMLGLGETAALGAFVAQDLLLFVLFFDLMLVPFWFLIGAFGGENRVAATTKMIVYTLVGSLLMLVAAIATAILSSDQVGHLSFSIADLRAHTLGTGSQEWIFLFFAAAFLIKMPAVVVHGWLPDAYRAAPLPVLALLAGVLSKVGAYGFLRVALPLYPQATAHFQELILLIGVGSVLYGSVMAFTQTNVRLIAGYSSIAQLGFITIGIFSLRPEGADGSVLQMVNHGLISATLFLLAGMIERRTLTGELGRLGGMARGRPFLATVLMTTGIIALAVPFSSAFAGEFLILAGVFQQGWGWAVVGAAAIVLAAMYVLRLISAVLHRDVGPAVSDAALDLRPAELGIVVPLVACLLALSAWPAAISQHSFAGDEPQQQVTEAFR
jgi:NADH-quinone oxidoreductase subunit M